MTALRVVIVDDHPVFRMGLAALLGSLPGIELAGAAVDAADAVRTVTEHQPHVVLMDLYLPDESGIVATRRIRREHPGTAVVMLTMSESATAVRESLRAGAAGYVLKDAGPDELERAIRVAAGGGTVLSGPAGDRLRALLTPAGPDSDGPLPALTARERAVVDLVAAGHGNQAIARRLGLSSKTVANNVSALLTKLGVADRAALTALGREAGLGGHP